MAKVFRQRTREASILSRIESSKEYYRRRAISGVRDCMEPLSNAVATKLVESELVETKNKNGLETQVLKALEGLTRADDFDVDFLIAPFRQLVPQPHIVSLYLTAYVIEKLINHIDIIDIYGSDEEIYATINKQVARFLPM
jgi:hypothetical protein